MTEEGEAKAIELVPIHTIESPKPLQDGGFGAVDVDDRGIRAITYGRGTSLWELSTGARVDGSDWLRLHPDGRRAVRVAGDGGVLLCDVATRAREIKLEGIERNHPIVFGPGALLADSVRATAPTEGHLGRVRVLDLSTGERLRAIDEPHALSGYLPRDRFLLVGPDGAVSVWDLSTGERVARPKGPKAEPHLLRISEDGRIAVTVGKKGLINVWDVEASELVVSSDAMTKEYGTGTRPFFELLHGGERALFACAPSARSTPFIGVVDLVSGAMDLTWTTADEGRLLVQLQLVPNEPLLAILLDRAPGAARTLELWDVASRRLVSAHVTKLAKGFAVTRDRRFVVVGGGAWSGPHFFHVYAMRDRGAGAAREAERS